MKTTDQKRRPLVTRLINILLWLNGARKIYDSARLSNWLIDSLGVINSLPFKTPRLLSSGWDRTKVADTICFIKAGTSPHTIIFLHGGGYTQRPTLFHFKLMDNIHEQTQANIIFPLYPLAPNDNYRTAYEKVTSIYREVLLFSKGHCLTLMGDSAGGGLALGHYLHFAEQGIALPDKLILIAPFLDITMSNEDIPAIEKKDRMLGSTGLIEFGKRWAAGDNPRDYHLSPIYGDLAVVDKLLLVAGTNDILFPDAKLLYEKLKILGKQVEFTIGLDMPHDYPLMPTPEARQVINDISNYIIHSSCRIHHDSEESL